MLFGYDVIWGIMKTVLILVWFLGAGAVSLFILHFKPTRKLIKKYLPFLLTED